MNILGFILGIVAGLVSVYPPRSDWWVTTACFAVAALLLYWEWKEPKEKRCIDCKWLFEENFESIVGFTCRKGATVPRFKLINMQGCKHYRRIWWKFGRQR